MTKVLLFNPWAAQYGYRIPNSILQVAASVVDRYEVIFVDGNREKDPWPVIARHLASGDFAAFGCTVMPGPQLRQAIPLTKAVREQFPHVTTVWGGYFATNQHKVCLESGYVDYVINGPGDKAFPALLHALAQGSDVAAVPNLMYRRDGAILHTPAAPLIDPDSLPKLPYALLDSQYPLRGYLKKTFLGRRTAAYHSSMGCPFSCSFCAVVPIYNSKWKAQSAERVYAECKHLIEAHGADALEFHDNNFFVSEKRTLAFAKLIAPHKVKWWGEGRIDTIDKYSDTTLKAMRDSGCAMIFFGAETGNDALLQSLDKGGTQSGAQIKRFAARMKAFDIVPEYSFVLGFPGANDAVVNAQIDKDIEFIREIKRINPATEIIVYVYSPVPTEGSDLYELVKQAGFSFPERLEDWLNPAWQNFDLRKNPLTPWLKPAMIEKIRGFETVLNGYYPTVSDFNLSRFQRRAIHALSSARYRLGIYRYPYELKALQKLWRYRRPETEGFSMESSDGDS